MITQLQLTAAVAKGGGRVLYRVPLEQSVQAELATDWAKQLDALVKGKDVVGFDPAYNPEDGEVLRLSDFKMPDWLATLDSQSIVNLKVMGQTKDDLDKIRGLLGFGKVGGKEVVLFQTFSRSHVLRPGKSLFFEKGVYKSIEQLGMTLGDKLAGVLMPDGQLLFPTFRSINAIMPMVELYREASETEIREVLSHKNIMAEDAGALAANPSQWFSKRFALLKDSDVLAKFTPKQIQSCAKKYNLAIKVKDGKLVFPAAKTDAKRLLQFLNEELFRGAITEKLYSTNSKRIET